MPKIVDRAERREEIIDAYLQLVSQQGFEAVTTRVLTTHLKVSTGSLWNYFGSQTELVRAAFSRTFDAQNARLTTLAASLAGLEALSGFVREVLPLAEDTREEARLMIEFWHKGSAFQSHFGEVQGDSEREWTRWAHRFLREAQEDGDVLAPLDPALLADLLIVLLDGLQMQYTMKTPLGSTQELDRIAAAAVSQWLTPAGQAKLGKLRAARLHTVS